MGSGQRMMRLAGCGMAIAALLVPVVADSSSAEGSALPRAMVPCSGESGGGPGIARFIQSLKRGGAGTIDLAANCTYTATYTQAAGVAYRFSAQVTINGNGSTITTNQQAGLFYVDYPGSLVLNDVTVTGGNLTRGAGGGVGVFGASLTLNGSSSITENTAKRGGGVAMHGATVTLNGESSITYNTATDAEYGGGVYILSPSPKNKLIINDDAYIGFNDPNDCWGSQCPD